VIRSRSSVPIAATVDYSKKVQVSMFTAAEGPTAFLFVSRPAADSAGDLRGAIRDGLVAENEPHEGAAQAGFCDGTFSGRWVAEGAGQRKD
jgi:hypothetical protein